MIAFPLKEGNKKTMIKLKSDLSAEKRQYYIYPKGKKEQRINCKTLSDESSLNKKKFIDTLKKTQLRIYNNFNDNNYKKLTLFSKHNTKKMFIQKNKRIKQTNRFNNNKAYYDSKVKDMKISNIIFEKNENELKKSIQNNTKDYIHYIIP